MKKVFVIMGVSGCGKSTVGEALGRKLNIPFYDADDFHPQNNILKMSSGKPLTDNDREPWLEILASNIKDWCSKEGAVLACSALKKKYRNTLRTGSDNIEFIFLVASEDLIRSRFAARKNHFMPDSLIKSQFEALEEPQSALHVSAELTLEEIISKISRTS